MEGQEIFEWGIRSSFAIAVVGFVLFLGEKYALPKLRFRIWMGTLLLMAGLIFTMSALPKWQVLKMAAVESVELSTPFESLEKMAGIGIPDSDVKITNHQPKPNAMTSPLSTPWWMKIWIVGIILFLARLIASFILLNRKSKPLDAGRTESILCETLRSEVGVLSPVQLVEGESSAMTWGISRFKIALPESAIEWPVEHLEMILRHELAHLKRRDPLWLALSQFVAALVWFHPGIWIIIKRLGIEREKATDEAVLEQGIRPSSYAAAILSLSIPSPPSRNRIPSVNLCGMGAPKSKSDIEKRIKRVISSAPHSTSKIRRCLPSALLILIIAGGILSFVVAKSEDPTVSNNLNTTPLLDTTVVIDAGHGAHDSGVIREGVVEKELNLDIAKRVEMKLLKAGIAVVMTRDDDSFLTLGERKEIATQSDASLMVSIHCNSSKKGKSKGIECYTGGLISEANEQSTQLAEALLNHTAAETGTENSKLVTGSKLFLFRSRTLPTALIECGYISHAEEREKLATPEYREKLATGITKGVISFLATNPKRLDRSADKEAARIEKLRVSEEKQKSLKKKLDSITVPSIEFIDTPIVDIITFLRLRSVELDLATTDPARKGIQIIFRPGELEKVDISLEMKNATLNQILQRITQITGGSMKVLDFGVIIFKPVIKTASSAAEKDKKGLSAEKINKLKAIILPKIDFKNAALEEVLTFIQQQSIELDGDEKDPQKKGINIVYSKNISETRTDITLRLTNVPLGIALKYVCQLARCKYEIEPQHILITPVKQPVRRIKINQGSILEPPIDSPPNKQMRSNTTLLQK